MKKMIANFLDTRGRGHLTLEQEMVAGMGGLLLMFVVLLFSPYLMLIHRRRESHLRNAYRSKVRLLKLSELCAQTHRGLLLVEIRAPGCFGHLWWVESDRLDPTDCPLPAAGQTPILDAMEANFASDVCEKWCIQNLSGAAQNAALIDVNSRVWAKSIPRSGPTARMIDASLWWDLQRGSEGTRSRSRNKHA